MTLAMFLSGGNANTNPNGSLGGVKSATQVTSAILDNLFNDLTRQAGLVGQTDYRLVYIYNTGGSEETNVIFSIGGYPSITTIAVGLDPAGQGDGVATGVAQSIATPLTVPTNVIFYGQSYQVATLALGTLKPGQGYGVWIQRTSQVGVQGTAIVTVSITSTGNSLPTGTAPFGADGLGVGELCTLTTQGTGTFQIGFCRIGFFDVG